MTKSKKIFCGIALLSAACAVFAFCCGDSGSQEGGDANGVSAQTQEDASTGKSKDKTTETYLKGRELAFGLNGRKINLERGKALLREAADLGSVDAKGELAALCLSDDSGLGYDLAVEAAEAGNPFGQLALAACYGGGIEVVRDRDEASKLLRKAFVGFKERASKKDPRATLFYAGLAPRYERLEPEQVKEMLREAANAKSAEAAYELGRYYDRVGRDADGKLWLQRAEEAGIGELTSATGALDDGLDYVN